MGRPNGECFYNYQNKLFSGKPILCFGAAPFVFIFAVLSSLAALFTLFPAVACHRISVLSQL